MRGRCACRRLQRSVGRRGFRLVWDLTVNKSGGLTDRLKRGG